jgi:hypothetical protein
MGFHAFSLDPRTVLGVGPTASLEEIHEAYRAKSKKHHPDMGGDEWAFRMVARAYEVLKTTLGVSAARPWDRRGPDVTGPGRSDDWAWSGTGPSGPSGGTGDRGAARPGGAEARAAHGSADRMESASAGAERPGVDPTEIRTVDVELIWTRFDKDGPEPFRSAWKPDDATLSVCLVISWPSEDLVDRSVEFPSAAETLRTLIDLFEWLRGQSSIVAARSRIEAGRFVGWLSYPDVITAQDAFLALRETFHTQALCVKLQTRDERVPFDWQAEAHHRVMSQAS